MTREGIRTIAAIVLATLAALLLVACGSSDSTTSGASTSAEAPAPNPDKGSTAKSGSKNSQNGEAGSKQGGGSGEGSNGSGSAGSAVTTVPLEISGGGSAQFRSKGGDNSIQEFGEESDESELEEAAEALHGFYVARAEDDWSGSCSYLAKSLVGQLEQLASKSPQLQGKGCAVALHAFTRPLSSSERREITVIDAGSLRTEGEQSFLIYFGADKAVFAMPMVQEDGDWKITLLSSTALG